MMQHARSAGAILVPWSHRWLLWSFTRREFLDRYTGSIAGAAWALAHPLALLAIYAFVFTAVFRVKLPEGASTVAYTSFVAVTLWPWLMFSDGLLRGMASVQGNAALIRKVAFPHRLVVFANVLASFAVHLLGYVLVLVTLRVLGEPVVLSGLPAAAVILAALLLVTIGIAAALAAIQVLVRDVAQLVGVLLTFLFYATPVLYPIALVPEGFRPWLLANPLTHLLERLREVLIQGSGLAAGDAWMMLVALAVFAAGLWVFERLSPFFEDFL
ncbi:MAG TPA: ABC transporter permease [Usitatibacter sp.]|nr:ABC transporter permease [Usitatibacter sp.]